MITNDHITNLVNRQNQRHKRSDKDHMEATTPQKRPRFSSDLFGDIHNFDIEEDLLDLDEQVVIPTSIPDLASVSVPIVHYRRVLRHIPTVPYVPLATKDGNRVYLRLLTDKNIVLLEKESSHCQTKNISQNQNLRSSRALLSVDFHTLRREAEVVKERFPKIEVNFVKKDDAIIEENFSVEDEEFLFGVEESIKVLNSFEDQNTEIPDVGSDKRNENRTIDKKNKPVEFKLWVEKYKPRAYMDLLSGNAVNRALLHWLKLWDNCVFGRDYLAKHQEIREKYAKLDEKENVKSNSNKIEVQDDAYDEFGRPKQKVVLLHGAAGLGKTTAAHVIAKHAGYNVVELNASDDRSVEVFRKVLDSTTESRSELFQDGRPNCLVIDEIDGSPSATVDVLVNLVSGKTKEAGKSKNKKTKVLRRPIICICNDLYAPALKNLRNIALVVQFHPVSVALLVERIEDISVKENLSLDRGILRSIAEKAECDIRSCLSTMQFIKQKNGKLKPNLLQQLGSTNKMKGIFSVWDHIFFLPPGKIFYETLDSTKSDGRFNSVLCSVQNFGDFEQLQTGVFENYLKCNFRDSYFETILNGLEWNVWYSEIQEKINTLQNYSLYGYLPMYFLGAHILFGGRTKFPLQYPTNKVYSRSLRFTCNFKAQLGEIPPIIGRFVNIYDAILDIFPSMLSIIQPPTIRPISNQLWSPREREIVKNIVDIMIGYHLTYTQQRNAEGTYLFILDPDVEEVVRFDSKDDSTRKEYSYVIKQMISREVEIEKIRQEEPSQVITPPVVENQMENFVATLSLPPPMAIPLPTPTIPNWLQPTYKLNNSMPINSVAAKDFFGRPIIPKSISLDQAELNAQKARASEIRFRYKEGYSNAVRKKLKVKNFL